MSVEGLTGALQETTLDDLTARHRRERKTLQAKIQDLKKNAPKNDKKKRKEAMETVARLEADLDKRQADELKQAEQITLQDRNDSCKASVPAADQPASNDDNDEDNDVPSQQRVSKAQKRRDKKAQQARQLEDDVRAAAVDAINEPKAIEARKIQSILKDRKLQSYQIPSDGNCLYNAVGHQLQEWGLGTYSVQRLRDDTSEYIRANKDNCICYMLDTSDEQFEKYCDDIRSTTAWGGQLELQALSSVFRVPIEVVQADGPSTVQGADEKGAKLIITYHRHLYSLGEHYNSTILLSPDNEQEEANDGE